MAAPGLVQMVYMAEHTGQMIGLSTYLHVIKQYPYYFPEEIERQRKWELIPDSVHEQYSRELNEFRSKLMKTLPPSKGVFYWSQHPDEFKEWEKAYEIVDKELAAHKHMLEQKYYAPYGITINK